MVDSDNKLGKAKKLSVPGNRVDSLGSTDLEDLHRFTLDNRSQVTLSLSQIGKGAKVRTELYALTGSLNKRLKKTDFSKLGAKDLQGVLRRVSVSELGDLAAGEYYARVLGGKGKSRYQLKLSAAPIVDPSIVTPPVTTPTTPPVTTPTTPPVTTPVKLAKAQISRNPNGPLYTAELDFSKSQDKDSAEDKGLFRGAVTGRIENLDGHLTHYPTGDLVSFINADGQTEYQAKLLTATGSNEGPFGDNALFIKFIIPASYKADPDSLSSLQKAFTESAFEVDGEFKDIYGQKLKEGVYFGYGSNDPNITFNSGNLLLHTQHPGYGDGNDYIERGNHYGSYGVGDFPVIVGGRGNDTLYARNGDDFLSGGEGEDFLYGRAGNDELFGGDNNDFLFGGDGNDTLNGFLSSDDARTKSGEQFDYLTGGNGSDYFVLGNPNKFFYYGSGDGYAVIEDWHNKSDYIQVKGDASQYRLEFRKVIGSATLDTEIYYASGAINDLIAIVKDTIDVTFSRFRFVGSALT